jgi:Mn2+/Fe2+ NRAMP family transporter
MLLSNVVMWFIVVTTASTLHKNGIFQVDSADKAAQALLPIAGPLASTIFALGIIGTGLLAVPILAGSAGYAISDTLKIPFGLSRKFHEARGFYGVIILSMLVGSAINFLGINPMTALYYTAVLNGLIAPPLMVMLMAISNNRKVMGDKTNGRFSNLVGWIATGLMSAAALALVFTLLTGKS